MLKTMPIYVMNGANPQDIGQKHSSFTGSPRYMLSDPEKQRIKAAKLQIQKEVRFGPLASMKFDVPDKYGHHGGNVAKKIFSAENRQHVVDLCNPESEEIRKNISQNK